MTSKTIVFTKPYTAELLDEAVPPIGLQQVGVQMEYTVISGGTERANLIALPNAEKDFPKHLGYCGIGIVDAVGEQVSSVAPGDRVLVYHGNHTQYNMVPENKVTKVTQNVEPVEAAFTVIAAMGLGGVRRMDVELGESAMVMGLGLLGQFAVQFLHLSGAYPVIAADPNPNRRELALQMGADYALDPMDEDFKQKVKTLTGKGVNACVEVTGISAAMKQALECMARQGRISLLGCTRVSDCAIDFYTQVHRPGIQLLGAHNSVRPKEESYPHHWTHQDDCKAILKLLEAGRVQIKPIISRVVKPDQAPDIYTRLVNDPNFPLGTVFDWRENA